MTSTLEPRDQDRGVVGVPRVFGQDPLRHRLRPFRKIESAVESARDAVGREEEQSGSPDHQRRSDQGRQPHAYHPAPQDETMPFGWRPSVRVQQDSIDISYPDPGQDTIPRVPARQAQRDAARGEQALMAALDDLTQRL